MAKKITEQQRVEQVFLTATLEEAQRYLAVAGAILMARFPQAVKVKATNHRGPRKKQPLTPAPAIVERGEPFDKTRIERA